MEEQEFTKAQSAINKSIERCIKRFEKIEKKLQQPWRNSSESIKKVHKKINHLKDVSPKVGKMPNVRVKLMIYIMNTIALSMETELNGQNTQKAIGEEITPFGEVEL